MSELNEKTTLLGLLEKTTGQTTEELQELLYEKLEGSEELTLKQDSLDILLAKDADRISSIQTKKDEEWKPKLEKIKDDQVKFGKKQGLEGLEKELIEEFKIDAKDKKGIELVKAIIAANTKSELSADEIRKTKEFLELENRIESEYVPKSDYETIKSEFENHKSSLERSKTMSVVNEQALDFFRGLNPKLPENPKTRSNQEKMFINDCLSKGNYKVDGDDVILLNEDGTRMEDKHGNRIKFKDWIEDHTRASFELLKQKPTGGPENTNDDNTDAKDLPAPKDLAEFNEQRAKLNGKELLEYSNKYLDKFK